MAAHAGAGLRRHGLRRVDVLASFLAGLALGSYSGGRVAGRLRSPLLVFGLIGIGAAAFATPALLAIAKDIWIATEPSLSSSLPVITFARFAAAFAVLIVPTTLMGATLPVVMESALVKDRAVASRIGLLYAANTAGAIVGALTAGFYLVSHIGIEGSFRIAALTNASIGLVAITLALRTARSRSGLPDQRARASARASGPAGPGFSPGIGTSGPGL